MLEEKKKKGTVIFTEDGPFDVEYNRNSEKRRRNLIKKIKDGELTTK